MLELIVSFAVVVTIFIVLAVVLRKKKTARSEPEPNDLEPIPISASGYFDRNRRTFSGPVISPLSQNQIFIVQENLVNTDSSFVDGMILGEMLSQPVGTPDTSTFSGGDSDGGGATSSWDSGSSDSGLGDGGSYDSGSSDSGSSGSSDF